jgi:hypothetical protein
VEVLRGVFGLVVGESYPAMGECGVGDECSALEASRDPFQLVCRVAGSFEISAGDLDVDLRGKQRSPMEAVVGGTFLGGSEYWSVERIADAFYGSRDVALSETDGGETRLRIPSGAMRFEQRVFGAGNVTSAEADLAELGQRPPQLASKVGAKLVAGRDRFELCVSTSAAQPENLGAVNAAATVQAADGVRLTPPFHHLGPFLGQVILGDALQGAHQLAVHNARRQRIQLSRCRRDPHLLQQRQSGVDIAVED